MAIYIFLNWSPYRFVATAPATLHAYRCTCGIDYLVNKLSKMVGNSTNYAVRPHLSKTLGSGHVHNSGFSRFSSKASHTWISAISIMKYRTNNLSSA